jgi:uncharacterized protein YjbI with pentapeptide repeats
VKNPPTAMVHSKRGGGYDLLCLSAYHYGLKYGCLYAANLSIRIDTSIFMNNRPGIILKKPCPLRQKDINVNWRNVYTATIKALVNLVLQKHGVALQNLVDIGAAIGITNQPEEIAWLLISAALTQAIVNLIGDDPDLLQEVSQGNELKEDQLREFLDQLFNACLEKLESENITIYQDFFECPQKSDIIAEIKDPFAKCLKDKDIFNLNSAKAEKICDRLPTEFLYTLYSEFNKHPDKYGELQTKLHSNAFSGPVEKERKKELSWRRYSAWLQKQVEERMFDEAFGLKQVYVPLRAFYEEKDDRRHQSVEKNVKRYVVNLQDELQTWLDKADKTDAIRVISGGPGSGKSSFAKMLAATLAETRKIPVLFIPLHLFNPEADLAEAIGKFIESMRDMPLPANPLKEENFVDKLLIIFDGLDELAMQGKMAEEVAKNFIIKVINLVRSSNDQNTRLLALIDGREIVVQRNESQFKSKQILHILPYFVDKKEIENRNFIDENNLLQIDQRQIWWEYYGKAKGCDYSKLPDELDRGNLREITAQPLLNYLVALSYEKNTVKFTPNSNLNEIYADLISKVYQRVWAKNHNPHIQGVKEKDFVQILESIAIAAWHGGDVRVTTLSEIEKYCDRSIIDNILKIFSQGKEASFIRLLTAFYFRHGGKNSEKTFEFTHKSFGEYLAAKGIVWELQRIHKQLPKNQEDKDSNLVWNEKQALEKWAKICGLTAMDEYIFKFIVDEIRWQKDNYEVDIGALQQTMCYLIGYMLKYGMPMETLQISTFQEANRQARNGEEALLAVLNACARVTKEISKIKWHSSVLENVDRKEKEYFTDFGNWISRLRGQRVNNDDVFCLNCLSFLDLQNCILTFQDFYKAKLQGAKLQGADLRGANLLGAKLQGADLQGANLQEADLQEANLLRADLQEANLQGANLQGANLQGANLQGANLRGAFFREEDLKNVDFTGAENVEEIRIV